MTVIVAGHWPGGRQSLDDFAAGLKLRSGKPTQVCPFGASTAIIEAWAAVKSSEVPVGNLRFDDVYSLPRTASNAEWAELAHRIRVAMKEKNRLLIEAGHQVDASWGKEFAQALLGNSEESLTQVRDVLSSADIYLAASTTRPLIGMASVMATTPDLETRTDVSSETVEHVRALYAGLEPLHTFLPVATDSKGSTNWAYQAYSGAGGGLGALMLAADRPVLPTGDVLMQMIDVPSLMRAADLLVVAEPYLHSPILAEAQLDVLTEAAAEHAIPVVAVCVESTVSRHERAQWNLHGIYATRSVAPAAMREAGERIAQTWLPR